MQISCVFFLFLSVFSFVKVLGRMVWHVVHFHISMTKVFRELHNILQEPALDTELFKVIVISYGYYGITQLKHYLNGHILNETKLTRISIYVFFFFIKRYNWTWNTFVASASGRWVWNLVSTRRRWWRCKPWWSGNSWHRFWYRCTRQ